METATLKGNFSTHKPAVGRRATTFYRTKRLSCLSAPTATASELRVCTSRTCRKQGSQQVLKFLQDLAQDTDLRVRDCSCLGNCGGGPNMVVMPQGKQLEHVATVEDATRVVSQECGVPIPGNVIQSMELKLAGNEAAIAGRFDEAIEKYTAGIALNPSTGLHLLLCNRASALLQQGRSAAALADAELAMRIAPPTFINGWVRLVDCQFALGQYAQAAETSRTALQKCPQIRVTSEFKSIVQALKKAGHDV